MRTRLFAAIITALAYSLGSVRRGAGHDGHDLRPDRRFAGARDARRYRNRHRPAGCQDRCDRRRRAIHGPVSDAGTLRDSRRTGRIRPGRSIGRASAARRDHGGAAEACRWRSVRDRAGRCPAHCRYHQYRLSARISTLRRCRACRSAGASATRSISRRASAPAAPSAVANPSIAGGPAVSKTSTSSTA